MIAEEEDQRELAPSRTRTPEQRAADARAASARAADLRDPDLMARVLLGWKEHEAALDDLHVANRHLAGRLDKLERDIARLLAAVPSAGVSTIQEQCQAVTWRPPTKEDEG